MPPKKAMNPYQRQNMLHIKEQEMLNREQKAQDQAQREREQRQATKLRSQYGQQRRSSIPKQQQQQQQQHRQPPQQPMGEQIEVFVRETDPAMAQHYIINEGLPPPGGRSSPQPADSPRGASALDATHHSAASAAAATATPAAASSPVMCGSASGMAGAARRASNPTLKAGHIPAYLKQRKQELQDEKDEVARQLEEQQQRKQYPAGHVPLGEAEKQEILKGLEAKKNDLLLEVNKLPMRFDTTSVKKRRNALEEQIRDVESRITTFSRKQVFVPT